MKKLLSLRAERVYDFMSEDHYPQLKNLGKFLKGEMWDRQAIEIAIYDKEGKLIKIMEGTLPNEMLWKKKDFRLLRKKGGRELLLSLKGKGFQKLKLYYYPPKAKSEDTSFIETTSRGLAVAEGGVHPVIFTLDISEAKKAYNALGRLVYRLRKRRNTIVT